MEPRILREQDLDWGPHRTYPRVQTKAMLSKAQQPAFSVHRVRVEPGAEISPHVHDGSAETFFILSGTGCFIWATGDVPCGPGSLGVAPAGFRHGIRNTGTEALDLLAIFSPPMV